MEIPREKCVFLSVFWLTTQQCINRGGYILILDFIKKVFGMDGDSVFVSDKNIKVKDSNKHWIYVDSDLMEEEKKSVAQYIADECFKVANNQLTAVFKYEHEGIHWTFLLIYEDFFPIVKSKVDLPLKCYYIKCSSEIIDSKITNANSFPFMVNLNGQKYVYLNKTREVCNEINEKPITKSITEPTIEALIGWIQKVSASFLNNSDWEQLCAKWANYDKLQAELQTIANTKTMHISKLKQGVQKYNNFAHASCQKVVISDRAYAAIMSESYNRYQTETGGVLLGHFADDIWYIVEATDPGMNAVFSTAYHEGDDKYYNHLCPVVSRLYKHPLVLLGMWHRHPGSFDRFSGTDDGTNREYARTVGNGSISALVNFDNEFRITMYYVDIGKGEVMYYSPQVLVGDEYFKNTPYKEIAKPAEIKQRFDSRKWC